MDSLQNEQVLCVLRLRGAKLSICAEATKARFACNLYYLKLQFHSRSCESVLRICNRARKAGFSSRSCRRVLCTATVVLELRILPELRMWMWRSIFAAKRTIFAAGAAEERFRVKSCDL